MSPNFCSTCSSISGAPWKHSSVGPWVPVGFSAPVIRPRRDRGEDERPLNMKQWRHSIAIVAVLVLGVGAWLVGAGASTWVGIAVVAVGVGAIGWWYARRRIRYSAEEDGE